MNNRQNSGLKHFAIFLLFILITSSSLLAQTGTLKGTVKDLDGEIVAYATVLVFQGDAFVDGARADEEGTFQIDSLSPGAYVVSVRFFSNDHRVEPVQIEPGETTTLAVKMDTYDPIDCGFEVYWYPDLYEVDPIPSGAVYRRGNHYWHAAYIPQR